MWILAADIGGTNTRLLAVNSNDAQSECAEVYPSNEYPDLIPILQAFKQKHSIDEISTACFAVAGPVKDNRAKITNLPWQLDSNIIMQQAGIGKLSLINDFEGVACSIATLQEQDLVTLQPGIPDDSGMLAVLGAGTGLGEAFVKRHRGESLVIPGEGGHAGFAPNDDEELALLDYWMKRLGRVSWETFLSGQGLTRVFDFYRDNAVGGPDRVLSARMKEEDPAAVITEYALKHSDPLAEQALHRFVMIYASQAANLALTVNATGGVYLAGGIAPKIISALRSESFTTCFNRKPPMEALLAQIPVRVIMNGDAGLLGALNIARAAASHR